MALEMERIEKVTKEFYADGNALWRGEDYEKYRTMYKRHHEQWNLKKEYGGKLCLDAGCGSGVVSDIMLSMGADKVSAIDLSERNVALAREHNKKHGGKFNVQQQSVLALPFENNTFDFIWCFGVLHHTKNPYKGFTELIRVAKPGAKILVGLYGKGGLLWHALNFCRLFTAKTHIIPYGFVRWFSISMYRLTKNGIWLALIDGLCAPIREDYTEEEIEEWGRKNNLNLLRKLDYEYIFYKWPKFLSGNGMVIDMFEKK